MSYAVNDVYKVRLYNNMILVPLIIVFILHFYGKFSDVSEI